MSFWPPSTTAPAQEHEEEAEEVTPPGSPKQAPAERGAAERVSEASEEIERLKVCGIYVFI